MEGEKAHHLARVLRAQSGQLYELSDGKRLQLGRIEAVTRDRVEFSLLEELPANEPSLQITLLLSIVKFDSFEWAIEKATELGVTSIVPLAAARSEKGLLAAAEKRAERWARILLEAAQQSRRVRLPTISSPVAPREAFANRGAQLGIFLSERQAAPPLRESLTGQAGCPSAVLAIGPEGGWTDQECAAAAGAGLKEASLGSLILRAETAVIAALAALRYALDA